jgi:hypothetical protein
VLILRRTLPPTGRAALRARTYLFSEVPVRERFEKMLRVATRAVESMDGDEILACDLNATVAEIMKPFRFEFPAITEAGITTKIDPPTQLSAPTPYVIRFFIPFAGEPAILKTLPITPPGSPPHGRLHGAEIQVTFTNLAPDPAQLKNQFDQVLSKIKAYLAVLATETEREFADLSTRIRNLLAQKRARFERAGHVARDLGYPLRRRDDPSGMAVPLVRKPITDIAPPGAPKPVAMEPYIEEAIYDEILNVLASMSLLIERNKRTFAQIDEPTIRDHFLLQLNGQFEGKATGETFNGEGKTDILLREQDKNLFIAECKFWDGPQSLTKAIDQLLGYATWRDSKAAILVFSRRRDFTRTVEEAGKALREHPQFREPRGTKRETSFHAWMARRDDNERRIDLTVMLFNVPSDDLPK